MIIEGIKPIVVISMEAGVEYLLFKEKSGNIGCRNKMVQRKIKLRLKLCVISIKSTSHRCEGL